jgi:hypothetical protein
VTDVQSSPDGKTVYVSTRVNWDSTLYAFDKATGKQTRLQYGSSWVGLKFSVNHDGIIHAADLTNNAFVQIQDNGGGLLAEIKRTQIKNPNPIALWGPELLRSTGELVFTSSSFSGSVNDYSVLLSDKSGNIRVLTAGPPTGWGMPRDLALNNAFEPYGHGTPGANQYRIVDWPNPGGRPEVGNAKFSLTVQSTPGAPTRSFMLLGLAPDDRPFLGIRLLINISQPNWLFPMGTAQSAVFPLPIPNLPSFRNQRFYAQSAHADAGASLATSNGVDIYIH